jgi:excisionase family DNA binding protein
MEISLDEKDLEAIAAKMADRLAPLLRNNRVVDDIILDVADACQLLKISRESLYQLVDNAKYGKNTFPYLKCGRRLRFSRNDLIAWLKNNKSG